MSYSNLAHFMGTYSDHLILRTFSDLNIKNLLYYQAELAILERELELIEDEDRRSSNPVLHEFDTRWSGLVKAYRQNQSQSALPASSPITREEKQWDTFLRIRVVLAEYSKPEVFNYRELVLNRSLDDALLRQSQISGLNAPHRKDLQSLCNWLDRPNYGNGFLAGSIEDIWAREKSKTDFVSFQAGGGMVYQLSCVWLYLVRILAGYSGHHPTGQVFHMAVLPDGDFANGVLTVLCCAIPIIPIIVFFFVNHQLTKLILALVFTIISASILVFGLRLKSNQVLATTLAFAAIQVVYLAPGAGGGSSSSTSTSSN